MELELARPTGLSPIVLACWQQRAVSPERMRIVPTGRVELIFRIDGAFSLRRARALSREDVVVRRPCFLSGLHTGPLDLAWGACTVFGVTLHPVAVRALFGLDCAEARDAAIAVDDLETRLARWEDRLASAPDFAARVRITRDELAVRIARSPHVEFAERLQAFTNHLPLGADPATIRAGLGYSRSHTHRLFREWLGVSAGQHMRLRRFAAACEALHGPGGRLADVALTTGFYDQSHLTRVFRDHAEVTPTMYRSRAGVAPGQLTLDGTSVQDRG